MVRFGGWYCGVLCGRCGEVPRGVVGRNAVVGGLGIWRRLLCEMLACVCLGGHHRLVVVVGLGGGAGYFGAGYFARC